ncbi:MAG TPA: hypothetical protein VN788_16110 [Verrucomicrobiae bacterium]|nr:hypothetical protein [Verrucomicrobiae bacterium]
MSKTVMGFFDTYGEAADVVRDLELAGIVGEQVELVSAAEEEVPFAEGSKKSSSAKRKAKAAAHDYYAEDPEFFAGESRGGRAAVIVRPVNSQVAETAAALFRSHGAESPRGGSGPDVQNEDARPETSGSRSSAQKTPGIGANAATTGGAPHDLEARGQQPHKKT